MKKSFATSITRRKGLIGISVVVAYLLLVVLAFVADVSLSLVFLNFLRRTTSMAPSIITQTMQGTVSGYYYLTYITQEINYGVPGRIGYTFYETIPALKIFLVNIGPFPTQVVLLAYYGGNSAPVHLLDVAAALGILSNTSSPYPLKVIENPSWFPGMGRAIYLEVGETAILTIPTIFGLPTKLLACTPVGCTLLKSQGETEQVGLPPVGWVINGSNVPPPPPPPPPPTIKVEETVKYRLVEKDKVTTVLPPTSSEVNTTEEGHMLLFSAIKALPPTIVGGYYSTDPSFSFSVPSSVSILGGTYQLPPFSFSGEDKSLVPTSWLKWDSGGFTQTLEKTLYITVRIHPVAIGSKSVIPSFADIFKRSQYIFVYTAVKGSYNPWGNQVDDVKVSVYYVDSDNIPHLVGSIESSNGFVDNSANLTSTPFNWAIPVDAEEIDVSITYHMIGAPPVSVNGRQARLAFYVALIPQEWIS